jgi:rod shape-determining protein MreC
MVAARVVTDSRGPFANSRLANAGRERGVRAGNPVMSENGLVGRVVGVTEGVSRVLLLTDIAARTPVMIDRTNARAILRGDGGPNPRLDYMRGKDPAREGDRVLTSGDGGVLPRGLPVGVAVKGLDGRWRVALASDAAPVDYVRILLFRDFTQLASRAELDRMTAPPPIQGAPTIGLVAPGAAPPAVARTSTPPTAPAAKSSSAHNPAPADADAKPIPTPSTTAGRAPAAKSSPADAPPTAPTEARPAPKAKIDAKPSLGETSPKTVTDAVKPTSRPPAPPAVRPRAAATGDGP